MTSHIIVNELEDKMLRQQFNDLVEAMKDIVTVNPDREEGAYESLNQRIHQAVTDNPILARIVSGLYYQSLLSHVVSNLNLKSSYRVIKCLIQANPSALLGLYKIAIPIKMIAKHPAHCVLLPWIATNYIWVLDHEYCLEYPPVFDLLEMYAERGRTSCTATTIKDFFEVYPRAFTQQHTNDGNILHKMLRPFGCNQLIIHYPRSQCEAELFKWLAERCLSGTLVEKDSNRNTLLHLASGSLVKYKGRNSSDICKYLIQKCPDSVRIHRTNIRYLPIHLIQRHCEHRLVREVVLCLLRAYPESYNMAAASNNNNIDPCPSSIPFIQSIKPYLDEERELQETVASLKNSTLSLTEAVTCTNNQLMRSASTVFDSWATSFINTTEDKLQLISTQLQDMCNEGRESNV